MKRLWMLGVCLLLAAGVQAQEVYNSSGKSVRKGRPQQKQGFDPQRLVVGGGIGLSFGTITNIAVAPKVGYRITDNFAAGIGLGYQYLKYKDYYFYTAPGGSTQYLDWKTSIYSASVWARYIVWKNLFVHAEYEQNFMKITDYFGYDPNGSGKVITKQGNYNAPALLLGAGYRQPLGENSSLNIMLQYDVIQNKYSPYGNQIFPTVGFLIGF